MRNSVLLNIGVVGIPVGLVVAFEALRQSEDSLLWAVIGIWGIIISLFGVVLVIILLRDFKRSGFIKAAKEVKRDKLLEDAVSELKKLNARGGEIKDGRKDNPNRK